MVMTCFLTVQYVFWPWYYYDLSTGRWRNDLVHVIEEYDSVDASTVSGLVGGEAGVKGTQGDGEHGEGGVSMSALHTPSDEPGV